MAKNKHDLLFRKILSNVPMFKTFCEVHLPPDLKRKINLNKLRLQRLSGNFIRTQIVLNHGEEALQDKKQFEALKEEIADIIYSAELVSGGEVLLILHVEHQSTPDKLYPLRNALYDISAIKDYVEHNQLSQLPVPISLIYYHGKLSPYPYSTDIMDLFTSRDLAQACFLKPHLIDLGQFTDQQLLSHGKIAGFEISHKHAYDKCISEEMVFVLARALKFCTDVELRQVCYAYTVDVWDADKKSLLDICAKIIPDDRGFIMTVAEQLRQEGLQKGLQKGEALGRDKKAREIALEMLKNNQTIEMVSNCAKLSTREVISLRESITC